MYIEKDVVDDGSTRRLIVHRFPAANNYIAEANKHENMVILTNSILLSIYQIIKKMKL